MVREDLLVGAGVIVAEGGKEIGDEDGGTAADKVKDGSGPNEANREYMREPALRSQSQSPCAGKVLV